VAAVPIASQTRIKKKIKVLYNPFADNGYVNTPTTTELLLQVVFSARSLQSGFKKKNPVS
jgi:hypothetical protein